MISQMLQEVIEVFLINKDLSQRMGTADWLKLDILQSRVIKRISTIEVGVTNIDLELIVPYCYSFTPRE